MRQHYLKSHTNYPVILVAHTRRANRNENKLVFCCSKTVYNNRRRDWQMHFCCCLFFSGLCFQRFFDFENASVHACCELAENIKKLLVFFPRKLTDTNPTIYHSFHAKTKNKWSKSRWIQIVLKTLGKWQFKSPKDHQFVFVFRVQISRRREPFVLIGSVQSSAINRRRCLCLNIEVKEEMLKR